MEFNDSNKFDSYGNKYQEALDSLYGYINKAAIGDYVVYACRKYKVSDKYYWDNPVIARIESKLPYKDYIFYQTKPNLTVKFIDGETCDLFDHEHGLRLSRDAMLNYARYMPLIAEEYISKYGYFTIEFIPKEESANALGTIKHMKTERKKREKILEERKEEERLRNIERKRQQELERQAELQRERELEEANRKAQAELDDLFK